MIRTTLFAAALALLAAPAFAQTTAAQAAATFDRIRTRPAELKMHCEQLRLQGDSIAAQMKGDRTGASAMSVRVDEIQAKLTGYRDAVNLMADKAAAGGIEYFKTPEGKLLDKAQRQLTEACASKAPRVTKK